MARRFLYAATLPFPEYDPKGRCSFTNDMMFGGGKSTYNIDYALRFRAANSAYLTWTPGGAGNRKTWTASFWLKRGALGSNQVILSANMSGGADYTSLRFRSDDTLGFATGSGEAYTASIFRDPTAWYHILVQCDTTQATAADRIKFFVNGVQQTMNGSSVYQSLNADLGVNGTEAHSLGRFQYNNTQFFDGLIADFNLIGGSLVAASSFGETSTTTGQWVPKAVSGLTYGTNGRRYQFEDATSTTTIGYDTSGNANHATTSGISVTAGVTFDQSADTPTNSYATFNPLAGAPSVTLASANTSAAWSGGSITSTQIATQPVQDGTYFEITVGTNSNSNAALGLLRDGGALNNWLGNTADGYAFYPAATGTGTRGRYFNNGGSGTVWGKSATGFGLTTYGVYYSGGSLYFRDDTGWMNGSDSNDATPTSAAFTGLSGTFFPAVAMNSGAVQSTQFSLNCGQQPFIYTPPSGAKKVNTANEPGSTIINSRDAFYAATRAGTGAAASITAARFQPGLAIIKGYPSGSGTNWNVFDDLRGTGTGWNFNGDPNPSDYTDANTLTAFNSNGISLGSDASSRGVNISGATYVDYLLRLGPSYGVVAVQYTGNGSTQAVAHTLGVAPECIITKAKTNTQRPTVLAPGLGATQYGYINLNGAFTSANAINRWGNNSVTVAPTSTHFTVGNNADVNENGTVYIAYLFVSIPGFSRIFSYTGNGSADGPFLPMNFKPLFFLIKDLAQVGGWRLWDGARDPYNGARNTLVPNSGGAQNVENFVNFTSRGVKIITGAGGGTNDSGILHLGMAFAACPSKYATAV